MGSHARIRRRKLFGGLQLLLGGRQVPHCEGNTSQEMMRLCTVRGNGNRLPCETFGFGYLGSSQIEADNCKQRR